MRAVDEAVLARLGDPVVGQKYRYFRADVGVTIHDGFFDARNDAGQVVVTYPLPYAVYYSSVGDDDDETRRLSADIPRDSVSFSFTYVGLDRQQAKWAGERIHDALKRWRPTIPGFHCEVVRMLQSQRIRRDDDAVRPDGTPLFYGVTDFAVGVRPSA